MSSCIFWSFIFSAPYIVTVLADTELGLQVKTVFVMSTIA